RARHQRRSRELREAGARSSRRRRLRRPHATNARGARSASMRARARLQGDPRLAVAVEPATERSALLSRLCRVLRARRAVLHAGRTHRPADAVGAGAADSVSRRGCARLPRSRHHRRTRRLSLAQRDHLAVHEVPQRLHRHVRVHREALSAGARRVYESARREEGSLRQQLSDDRARGLPARSRGSAIERGRQGRVPGRQRGSRIQAVRRSVSGKSQFGLLKERRFGAFFCVQTLGAFNDNVFKNALGVLVTFGALALTPAQVDFDQNLAAVLFILPFFLFSATSGQIAERYEKSRLIRGVKLLEVAIAILAAIGLYLKSVPFLFAVLFLLGLQATLFGPVKYSILPQVLHPDEIVGGNALVETATSLAILLGLMVGGILMSLGAGTTWVSLVVLTVAVAGYLASRAIPPAAASAPDLQINWNPVT